MKCLLLIFAALPLLAQVRPTAGPMPPRPTARQRPAQWLPLLNSKDLAGWHARKDKEQALPAGNGTGEWFTSADAGADPADPKKLAATPGEGGVIVNGPNGKTTDLVTDRKFSDVELFVQFMIPKGSNSGVYLHGLYEVQIFDSYGKDQKDLGTIDSGAIYHRWIDEKPVGGSAPKTNAAAAPGQWQTLHILFQAPRFSPDGKKTVNAKFLKVVYNGQLVQENVEVDGPTRAHMDIPEAPVNPLMLQGDHGPVAFRNIRVRALRPTVQQPPPQMRRLPLPNEGASGLPQQ